MVKEQSYNDPSGVVYKAQIVQNVDEHPLRKLSIHRSDDSGTIWHPMPLQLQFWSAVRFKWLTPWRWPPETFQTIGSENGLFFVDFRDPVFPYETPLINTGLDKESEWRSTFNECKNAWSLHRLRLLDYDGLDKPPSWS